MFLVFSSTPARPMGLFETIEKEDPSIYYKMFLPYQYGLEGPQPIYGREFIEKMKRESPEFPREFALAYLGTLGNCFSQSSIELAQTIPYNPDINIPGCKVSIGVDPSFGSSKFGIVATRLVDQKIQVIVAEEYEHPDFTAMINRIWQLDVRFGKDSFIYCDAANPVIWRQLKKMIRELDSDSYVFDKLNYCREHNTDPNIFMRVIPVIFSKHHASMLQNAKSLVEDGKVLIDKRFDKLIVSLRTATAHEWKLDKEHTSYNDVLDAFRLSLQYYRIKSN
jgi:hypothetical protein